MTDPKLTSAADVAKISSSDTEQLQDSHGGQSTDVQSDRRMDTEDKPKAQPEPAAESSPQETAELQHKALENRIKQLEEQARFTLDILEMAASLGDFQTSINTLSEPSTLLDEAVDRINELVQFSATAFFLVDEDNSDFVPAYCNPSEFLSYLEPEIDTLIDNGLFALALRDNRPIIIYSQDNKYRFVLHVLATTSRTRGMFIGVMPKEDKNLSGILLSLLSIVLKHCANAIESFELYRLFHQNTAIVKQQLDAFPTPAMDCLDDGTILRANSAMLTLLGLNEAALTTLALDSILSKNQLKQLHSSLQEDPPTPFSLTLHLAGGGKKVICSAAKLKDEADNPILLTPPVQIPVNKGPQTHQSHIRIVLSPLTEPA